MSKIPALPRKTLVAVAVLALTSGCATTSQDGAHGGGIGGDIARAGQKTVGFGQTFVHRAGYLLGLHDDPGVPVADGADATLAQAPQVQAPGPDARLPVARPAAAPSGVPVAKLPLHLDEVDLALMEEDAVMPGDVVAPAVGPESLLQDGDLFAGATDDGVLDVLPFEDEVAPLDALATVEPLAPVASAAPASLGPDTLAAPAAPDALPALAAAAPVPTTESAPVAAPADAAPAVVAARDLEHRVDETETLWDIAKKTTGDATNWHVLADVNDLGPGASVFPGQVLTIPADMVRPELAGAAPAAPAAPTDAPAAAPAAVASADSVPAERLIVPGGPSPVAPPVTEPADGAREFAIAAGETLWDFAKRTTGDATNWQAIATQNGFDEKAAVAVYEGQRIFVPGDMVVERGAVASAAPAAAQPAAEPVATVDENGFVPIPQPEDTDGEAVDASAAVLAGTNGVDAPAEAGIDAEGLRIVEAAYTGGPATELPVADGTAPAPTTDSVMISGTYYPKAIYSDADFSAGLLTRVSPGTRLKVSSVDGAWYRVETERGTGWVHQRDVK